MRTNLVTAAFVAASVLAARGASPAATGEDTPARLTLADALRLADGRNPTLAAARQQAAIASASAVAARQWMNPVVSVSSEGYNGRPGSDAFVNRQELAWRVDQEIETAGRRRFRAQVADASVGAGRAHVEDVARELRLGVQRAYFQLVLARLDTESATTALAEIDKVIALNRSRYQQGEISGGELRRLEVERLRFTDDVLGAELGERHARSALLALVGAARLDAPLEPLDTLDPIGSAGGSAPKGLATPVGPADRTPGGVPHIDPVAQALAGRPDVAAARREQARAEAEVALQHALRTPNVTVGAGVKRDFGTNGLVVSVSLPLPVFDRNTAGIARAEAERRLAEVRLRERELAASLEVRQAADLVEISRQRVTLIEREYLGRAREARDAVLAAYRSGEAGLLDFLDAERAHRDVRRAHSRSLFDYRVSLFELEAAVGSRSGGLLP